MILFNSEQDAYGFLKFNIKFTYERQKDDKLGFLNMLISKTDQTFCKSVYRKMVSIGFFNRFLLVLPLTLIKLD